MIESRSKTPVFGQNGAVLNSATMTDGLRERHRKRPPSWSRSEWVALSAFAACLVVLAVTDPIAVDAGTWERLAFITPVLLFAGFVTYDFVSHRDWSTVWQLFCFVAFLVVLTFVPTAIELRFLLVTQGFALSLILIRLVKNKEFRNTHRV